MKSKIIVVSFLLVLLGAGFYSFLGFAQNASNVSNSLQVNIKSSKSEFYQGEIVSLDIELKNESPSDVSLHGVDVQSGYIKLLISNSQGDFKEYSNAAWGNKKSAPKLLKAGHTITSKATVLSNTKPEISHLSEDAAKRVSQGKILTDYAFPDAGIYSVKAVLIIPGENSISIESKPFQIIVNEPVNEDLEVWNKIKARNDIAYFMQESEVISDNTREKETFFQEIAQIVAGYPNSLLARQIEQSLEKFRVREVKRAEMMDKIKQ